MTETPPTRRSRRRAARSDDAVVPMPLSPSELPARPSVPPGTAAGEEPDLPQDSQNPAADGALSDVDTERLSNRPTRVVHPVEPPEEQALATPPSLTEGAGSSPLQMLLPVIGALTSVTMMVVLRHGQPLFLLLAAVIFVVAVVGGVAFALSSRGRAIREARLKREQYLDYLERTREQIMKDAREARDALLRLHPSPAGLITFVRDPSRLWERRRSDSDHLTARIGTGSPDWFSIQIPPPESPVEPPDPALLVEAELLTRTHSQLTGAPTVVPLRDASVVALIGPRERTVGTARALIAQLAAHQLPEDLTLAATFSYQHASDWTGLDLFPHAQSAELFDGPLAARTVAPDMESLARVLEPELAARTQTAGNARRAGSRPEFGPRIVVFADQHGATATALPTPDPALSPRDLGVITVHLVDDRLHEPSDVDVRIDLSDEPQLTLDAGTPDARTQQFQPDVMQAWQLHALARQLAALRTSATAAFLPEESSTLMTATELLGIDPSAPTDVAALWTRRSPSEFLRVPFGTDDNGQRVMLDIKESAQQGMGPHGICIGATGSGKSEMLRTLVLSLALTHSPEDLSMVLVDYKGGAAFSPFASLPHCAGLIDNLADDPQLTVRARSSLHGEVVRRQQLLKAADSSPNITHYRELRLTRPDLPPMPHLFVVIDEFAELLTAEREFVDLFLQIGRIGRSIGVHLLLSSQRLEAGQLRGLDTYLSYNLALRTFSESESQMVLGTGDAFHLPPLPGYGYLKVDTSVYQRFRAGYVSGPVPRTQQIQQRSDGPRVTLLPVFNTLNSQQSSAEQSPTSTPELERPQVGVTLVDEMVRGLRGHDGVVSPIWLPPLPPVLPLGTLVSDTERNGRLAPTIGLKDDPVKQRQAPWTLDLTRSGGHAVIIGAPQSGRTTALRTIAASLALTHTPKEVGIYGLDLTGSGLRRLEGFPHVGGVVTRGDEDRMQRLLEELTAMLRAREALFKQLRIDSMQEFRRLHAQGRIPSVSSADIVLLVDGYGALRSEFEQLEGLFTALMMQAASYGIHLIVTMGRWGEMRMAHQTLFGNRIELRLNDPSDSIIDRKLAGILPEDTAGRGLNDDQLIGQIALPIMDEADADDVGEALQELAQHVARSWTGPSAVPIRLLPSHLPLTELPDEFDEPHSVPLGLRQDTMDTTFWDLMETDQHLVVLGDSRAGKSTTLRTIADGLIRRFTPDELAIAVVDSRGHVSAAIPEEYLAAHARSPQQANGLSQSIATELAKRPGRSATEAATAPRIVLMIDDIDIITAGGVDPFAPLQQHLPMARDLHFHVILTRPVTGASRAMYAPFILAAWETGGAMLLMSGDRAEGQILPRVRPERMPAGRGRYIRRGDSPFVVQVAHETSDPSDD